MTVLLIKKVVLAILHPTMSSIDKTTSGYPIVLQKFVITKSICRMSLFFLPTFLNIDIGKTLIVAPFSTKILKNG